MGFSFFSSVSVCLFRPEARRLTNCGWLVLAWMSAGELLFYFAESPLTFISLHLLRDGDAKWQGLLSLFLLCLSVCPFCPPSLVPSLLLLLLLLCSSFFSLQTIAAAAATCILTPAATGAAQSELNLVCCRTPWKASAVSQRRLTGDGTRWNSEGEDVHDGIAPLIMFKTRQPSPILKLLKWTR